jgi:endonuclease/exonuclease/phosphatase (EEP) superfamily protein YafD
MLREWSFVPAADPSPPGSCRCSSTLDHVFYRLPSGAATQTREIEDAYGSDHRPLLGRVRFDPN